MGPGAVACASRVDVASITPASVMHNRFKTRPDKVRTACTKRRETSTITSCGQLPRKVAARFRHPKAVLECLLAQTYLNYTSGHLTTKRETDTSEHHNRCYAGYKLCTIGKSNKVNIAPTWPNESKEVWAKLLSTHI